MTIQKIGLPELISMIKNHNGPEGLDLSGRDLANLRAGPEEIKNTLMESGEDPERATWVSADNHDQPRLNLSGAILHQAELIFANLAGADLYRTDLREANLGKANMTATELVHADLQGANLIGADLTNANLTRAHLQSGDLTYATLDGIIWFGAYLDRTRINRRQLGSSITEERTSHKNRDPQAYLEAAETYLLLKSIFYHSDVAVMLAGHT